jgi:hypothetical protein
MAVSLRDDHRRIVDGFLRAGTVLSRSGLDNLCGSHGTIPHTEIVVLVDFVCRLLDSCCREYGHLYVVECGPAYVGF